MNSSDIWFQLQPLSWNHCNPCIFICVGTTRMVWYTSASPHPYLKTNKKNKCTHDSPLARLGLLYMPIYLPNCISISKNIVCHESFEVNIWKSTLCHCHGCDSKQYAIWIIDCYDIRNLKILRPNDDLDTSLWSRSPTTHAVVAVVSTHKTL